MGFLILSPFLDQPSIKTTINIEDGELATLKTDVKQNMLRELEQVLKNSAKDNVLTALVNSNEIEVPKALITSEVDVLRKQAMERYGKQMDPESPRRPPHSPSGLSTQGIGLSVAMTLVRHHWVMPCGTFCFTGRSFVLILRLKCFSTWHLGLNWFEKLFSPPYKMVTGSYPIVFS